MSDPKVELWQAEWCPWSRRVRQRLTELDVTFSAHQVPADRRERSELRAISGQDAIPVLRIGDQTIAGTEQILAVLDGRFPSPPGASAHRAKARELAVELHEA